MKIVKQSVELMGVMVPASFIGGKVVLAERTEPERIIERAGRVCYRSEDVITLETYKALVDKVCNQLGHESVAEHSHITFECITDRGVSHEAVRHRLCAFSQESTRYCNYSKGKFGGEITVVEPPGLTGGTRDTWAAAMASAELRYLDLVSVTSPQIARSVLPTCMATKLVWTANFREWKHIRKLRLSPKAHPQMQELMGMINEILVAVAPTYFKVSP